jgi:hypothetical protein
MLLTATTHSIELVTSSATATEYVTSFVDISATALTPGSSSGAVASATDTTIVAAPAASTTRQVKEILIRNAAASGSITVTLQKDVSGAEYLLTPSVQLSSGEELRYSEMDGVEIYYANGRKKIREVVTIGAASMFMSPIFTTQDAAEARTITTQTVVALWMGKAPAFLTSVEMRYRVTTAAATIDWAEVALATGEPTLGGATLNVVGVTDVAAVVNSLGLKTTTISVAAGQAVFEGDDLWLLIGNEATTAVAVRCQSVTDDLSSIYSGTFTIGSTVELNAVIGQPFVITPDTTDPPWFAIQI